MDKDQAYVLTHYPKAFLEKVHLGSVVWTDHSKTKAFNSWAAAAARSIAYRELSKTRDSSIKLGISWVWNPSKKEITIQGKAFFYTTKSLWDDLYSMEQITAYTDTLIQVLKGLSELQI